MKRLDTFRRDESGGATIEACLWLPFFAVFMIFVIDVTMVFMNESKVHHVVQDGNRQYVVGAFKDEANPTLALETWIEASLDILTPGAIATASLNPTTGILTTEVRYPLSETDLTGATGLLGDRMMRVQAIHQTEF